MFGCKVQENRDMSLPSLILVVANGGLVIESGFWSMSLPIPHQVFFCFFCVLVVTCCGLYD